MKLPDPRDWILAPKPPAPNAPAPNWGRWGEEHAVRWYRATRGAAILERNLRGGGGELDLILREGDTLVIVEVKARSPQDPDPFVSMRDPRRRRRLLAAARAWWRRLMPPRPSARIDLVLVSPDPAHPRRPRIEHHAVATTHDFVTLDPIGELEDETE